MADSLKIQVILDLVDKAGGKLRSLMDSSTRAGKSLGEARQQLKRLEDQQKSIGAYRELGAKLSRESTALQDARAKLKAMHSALQATETPTKALTKAFNDQLSKVGRLSQGHREQREKLRSTRAALEATGIQTSKLGSHQSRLEHEIAAANRQIDKQKAALTRLGQAQKRADSLKRGGMLMTAHGAGAWALKDQFAAPGKSMMTAFAQQETAATELRAAMMGANGQVSASYAQINALAIDLGNKLPGTSADLLEMMTMLKRQGMSDQVILGGLGKTAAYLGAQLKMPYTDAAEFAAKLQDATRTTEADMLQLGDTIQRAFYLGVDSDNMLQGFTKLSPAMDILRISGLEATKVFAPMLVMMDQMGMKGEQSGNALRKVFQGAMGGGVEKANDGLRAERSNIRLDFTDGKGEFGGLDKMFAQFEKLKQLNTQQRLAVLKTIFGDDSETLTTINALMNKGKAGYEEIQRKMKAQADLQTRVNASLGTLSALWEAATGTFQNMLAAFGEAAAPQIEELTKWLGSVSEKVMAWVKENPKAAAAVVKLSLGLGALLGAIGVVLVPLGMLTGIIGHSIMPLMKLGGAARWLGSLISENLFGGLLNGARMLLPVLGAISWPVLAIGAAVAVVAALVWKYWQPIKAFMGGVWDGILAAAKPALDGVLQALAPLAPMFSTLGSWISQAFRWLMNFLTPVNSSSAELASFAAAGKAVGIAIGNYLTLPFRLLSTVIGFVVNVFVGMTQILGTVAAAVVTHFAAMWEIIAGLFTGNGQRVKDGFMAMWNNIVLFFGTLGPQMMEIGRNIVRGLITGIMGMAGAASEALGGVANSAIARIKNLLGIKSPSRVFAELGGFTMAGFTQGLLGGEAGAQRALGRIGNGLRTTAAGLTLGTAGMALAAPTVPPMQAMRVQPQVAALAALPALPALHASITPQLEALGPLAPLHAATAPVPVDTRPPLAVGGATPASAGRGATYNITINTAPGSNGQDIAKAVRDEIERLEHQRRVRTRAELSDYE